MGCNIKDVYNRFNEIKSTYECNGFKSIDHYIDKCTLVNGKQKVCLSLVTTPEVVFTESGKVSGTSLEIVSYFYEHGAVCKTVRHNRYYHISHNFLTEDISEFCAAKAKRNARSTSALGRRYVTHRLNVSKVSNKTIDYLKARVNYKLHVSRDSFSISDVYYSYDSLLNNQVLVVVAKNSNTGKTSAVYLH